MILWSSHFLNKEQEKEKGWVRPILTTGQEQGEFQLRVMADHFQVYFRTSAVQFPTMPSLLEPHIEKNFCKLVNLAERLEVDLNSQIAL